MSDFDDHVRSVVAKLRVIAATVTTPLIWTAALDAELAIERLRTDLAAVTREADDFAAHMFAHRTGDECATCVHLFERRQGRLAQVGGDS